jgi:hypothetical protein
MLDGIFQHQDSNGGSGLISDIQWMTAVYSSSESLTGDLEANDDDAGVLQVYDAQARYLPLTWQAPDPRRRWAGQARLGPPQQGQEDRLHDALRRFLPLIGRADLAEAPVLDLQAAAQAISDQYGGRRPVQDGDGPAKGGRPPLPRTLNSYSCGSFAPPPGSSATASATTVDGSPT